jgi:hypothetical protein
MISTSTIEYEASDVALDADAVVTLGSIEPGMIFQPEAVVVRVTETMTAPANTRITVGTNDPNYDNLGSMLLTVVQLDTRRAINFNAEAAAVPGTRGTATGRKVKARIRHATGTGGKAHISVVGFLDPV